MKIVSLIMLFCFVTPLLSASAQSAQYTTSTNDAKVAGEYTQWGKDLDKKMDTAIEVLTVIREELQLDKEAVAPPAPGATMQEKISGMGKAAAKVIRVWNKVRGVTEKDLPADQKAMTKEEMEAWSKNVNTKLDKTVEAIKILQEELNKIPEESQAKTQTKK